MARPNCQIQPIPTRGYETLGLYDNDTPNLLDFAPDGPNDSDPTRNFPNVRRSREKRPVDSPLTSREMFT